MAAQMGIRDMSLAKLFANFFRLRISKNAQLSNWEADALDEKQRIYAATDADACLKLYHRMQQLQQTGNFQLVAPEIPHHKVHRSMTTLQLRRGNLKASNDSTHGFSPVPCAAR